MQRFIAVLLLAASAVPHPPKLGKWVDTTKDSLSGYFIVSGGRGELLLTEEYEVLKTHEICASLDGLLLEKAEAERYDVRFNGMRTSAVFTFSDRRTAEKWAEKWCTPESLESITGGRGSMGRKY